MNPVEPNLYLATPTQDAEALSILYQLAEEPALHRRYAEHYAYEFFVTRRRSF